MTEAVMDVATTLRSAQKALHSDDPQTVASAESVVSYLVLHLKHSKAPVPHKLRGHLKRVELDAHTQRT